MADTGKEAGAPPTEPQVTKTGGGDGKVTDAAKTAQIDEAKDEGEGQASVPIDQMTTANDK